MERVQKRYILKDLNKKLIVDPNHGQIIRGVKIKNPFVQ